MSDESHQQVRKNQNNNSRPKKWMMLLLIPLIVLGFAVFLSVGFETRRVQWPSFLSTVETSQQQQDRYGTEPTPKNLRNANNLYSSSSSAGGDEDETTKGKTFVVSDDKLVASSDDDGDDGSNDNDNVSDNASSEEKNEVVVEQQQQQHQQDRKEREKSDTSQQQNPSRSDDAQQEEGNLDQETKEDDANSFVLDNEQPNSNKQDDSDDEAAPNTKHEQQAKDSNGTQPDLTKDQVSEEEVEKPTNHDNKRQKELEGKLARFPECASSRRQEHPGIDDGPRVQYIHVPKAGGTSIQGATVEWVKRFSGGGRCSLFKYDGNAVRGSSLKCPQPAYAATILTGHRGFGYCDNIQSSSRGLFTFTALREPVARMISSYDYYLYNVEEERAVNVFGKQGLEFGDIIKKYNVTEEQEWGERLIRYSGQQQARFLCGYECMGPKAKGNKNFTEEYILEKALQNLEKLDAIGITEELNNFINQLRFHLPRLIPKGYTNFRRENSHTKKSILDDEAKSILRKWAWVDLTLYKRAREIYREKQHLATKCLRLFGELADEPENDAP